MLSFLNDIIATVLLVSSHGSLLSSGMELQLVLVLLDTTTRTHPYFTHGIWYGRDLLDRIGI